jgi:anthranilate synthase component 1
MPNLTRAQFEALIERDRTAPRAGAAARSGEGASLAVPLSERLLSDQLTPVLAYRRLVAPDERTAPSFLLESVEGGERQGRHSILGAQPALEVVAYGRQVRVARHRDIAGGSSSAPRPSPSSDPLLTLRDLSHHLRLLVPTTARGGAALPACFLGGWVGFAGYDTVRYAEPEKLGAPPRDDRSLPDLHFGFYDGVVVFDHVEKLVHVIELALVAPDGDPGAAYDRAAARLARRTGEIQRHTKPLPSGLVGAEAPPRPLVSNLTRLQHAAVVARARDYIAAGDVFQVVLGQRFERRSRADPFDVYRALRAVNPSPYMVYLQAEGTILVASSPEILCRVRREGGRMVVTSRPLAGTRRRGATPDEDSALERELLADAKERAEHIMLVDLGRNDVGRVAEPGSIALPRVMEVERYSHVMHISSTVTGTLRQGLDCWDALRTTLPVGTISGAPKIRAMQIIDELEPVKRGPYGGGMGYVGLDGQMDIALALRTIVVPESLRTASGEWVYHLQAAGGIVADSKPDDECQETVNKAAAMARAIDLAEAAFLAAQPTKNGPR